MGPAPRKKPAKKEGAATAGYPAPADGEEDPRPRPCTGPKRNGGNRVEKDIGIVSIVSPMDTYRVFSGSVFSKHFLNYII